MKRILIVTNVYVAFKSSDADLVPRNARRSAVYDDLDHLAGTWTEKDAEEFSNNIAFFDDVDQSMWQNKST